MVKNVTAVYEDGVLKPERPLELEEKTRVHLLIEDVTATASDRQPADWRAIDEMVGFIEEGLEEAVGRHHDRYLYRK